MIAHSMMILLSFASCIVVPFCIPTGELKKSDLTNKSDDTDVFFMRR